MQFSVLLFIFIFKVYGAFPSSTNALEDEQVESPITATTPSQSDEKGYECGNVFFSESEVEEVLSRCCIYMDYKDRDFQQYHGPLYDDSGSSEYLLWPILKGKKIRSFTKNSSGAFYVVFRRDTRRVIDVISRITNLDYTKCIRRGIVQPESSSSILQVTNGYQCGYEFFSDEVVQECASKAQNLLRENKNKYGFPSQYVGLLYPEDSGYLIWPLLLGKRVFQIAYAQAGPYYVIINKKGELIDMVVRGYSNNLLRCERSGVSSKAPVSDPQAKLFVPPSRYGYQCGKAFFNHKALEDAADVARRVYTRGNQKRFPEKYAGQPFYKPHFLWPILEDKTIYKKGPPGVYRVILSMDFEVKHVAIMQGHNVIACDEKIIKGKKSHDTGDYLCDNFILTNEKLVKTAEIACEKLSSSKRNFYPAKYKGPSFEKEGPYFTYPIFGDQAFTSKAGLFRVVINLECEFVGALTKFRKTSTQKPRLVKCFNLQNGSLPPDHHFESQIDPISEHRIRY